jgi:uncharacterized membrane protein YdcZ (DUF606 family)
VGIWIKSIVDREVDPTMYLIIPVASIILTALFIPIYREHHEPSRKKSMKRTVGLIIYWVSATVGALTFTATMLFGWVMSLGVFIDLTLATASWVLPFSVGERLASDDPL